MTAKQAYSTPAFDTQIDLPLNANESLAAIPELSSFLAGVSSDFVSRYPSHHALQSLIGQWIGVDEARIVVTAGGDESIDRVVRILLAGDRDEVLTHAPSFEMVKIYTENHGGKTVNVPWLSDAFPLDELVAAIGPATALVVVTTPNNPTGMEVDLAKIEVINQAARQAGAKLLVDLAYVEFAGQDPTAALLQDDNVMMVRTFSKAWGLAGLRVGFLIAPTAEFAATIRNAAGPFPVSALSLETARVALSQYRDQMQANVATIVQIRDQMQQLFRHCQARPLPSGGNYLLVEFDDAEQVWQGLAERGIGVRKFVNRPELSGFLRITCPAQVADYLRLARAVCDVLDVDPEPVLAAAGSAFAARHVIDQPTPEPGTLSSPESGHGSQSDRTATIERRTKETEISLSVNLDGSGQVDVSTGIGFLDHMLTALAFHASLDLSLRCLGDLEVDDHHTAEDCAIALGQAIDQALGPRKGICRFGYAYAPLDEALARTVVDLSGRPWPEVHLHLQRPMIGEWACENITHFFQSLAMTLKCSLHVDVVRGTNDHHRVEAAFKSLAKALKEALTRTAGDVPSTKGVL